MRVCGDARDEPHDEDTYSNAANCNRFHTADPTTSAAKTGRSIPVCVLNATEVRSLEARLELLGVEPNQLLIGVCLRAPSHGIEGESGHVRFAR